MMDAPSASPDLSAPRRRGGRPRMPDAQLRGRHVGYRATMAEFAALESRAALAGLTVSQLIRATMDNSAGVPVRRKSRSVDVAPIVAQLARLGNNLNQIIREARLGNFPPEIGAAAAEVLRLLAAYLRRLADAGNDPED